MSQKRPWHAPIGTIRHLILKGWGGAFFLAGDEAKSDFLDRLLRAEHFGRLRLFGYAILDNHVHLAIEIPPGVDEVLAEDDYLARLGVLYRGDTANRS